MFRPQLLAFAALSFCAFCAQAGTANGNIDTSVRGNGTAIVIGGGPAGATVATLVAKRPEISLQTTDRFVANMFESNPDFVFSVTRDFVRTCQTPVLIMPDDIPAHPYAVAMESAMLAPNAEVSMFPWKEPKERIPIAVRQMRSFLRAHRPA